MTSLSSTTWAEIETLRAAIATLRDAASVQVAAQGFTTLLREAYPTVILARLFVVVPYALMPLAEQALARAVVADDDRLKPTTPVLSLLGTSGIEPAWNDRCRSQGHLAIPLLDRSFVHEAPMIAKLLSDLEIDLAGLDSGLPIATRRMIGGGNGTFYVADAEAAVDDRGRRIIPVRDFVERHGVRTVFGMGGAYLDGTLAVAIVFTSELMTRLAIDRFPSLISNFKMATSHAQHLGAIYGPGA